MKSPSGSKSSTLKQKTLSIKLKNSLFKPKLGTRALQKADLGV
jgi:hypothetical protein